MVRRLDRRKDPETGKHAQMGVYAWYLRLRNACRKRGQPAFWLPLQGVLAPESLVGVRREHPDGDHRVLWDGDLLDHGAVDGSDGLGEREDHVLAGSA